MGRRAVVIEPFLAEAETGNEMFSYGGEFSCCFPVLHIERFGPLSARARARKVSWAAKAVYCSDKGSVREA